MNLLHSIIIGLVQGATEFLPVSSSAHLIIVPWLFKWKDPGLSFDVALHWGTLSGVIIYFWRDWVTMMKGIINALRKGFNYQDLNQRLLLFVILATIPGAIFGIVLNELAETILRSPLIIGGTSSVFAIIIFIADNRSRKFKGLREISLKDCILIGFSQALAIIPGVSRSGATISAALFLGLTRESAARFSFLLSAPIIFGAGLLEIPSAIREGIDFAFIIGIISAAISGFLAIKWLLGYLQNCNYRIFVWYRLLFAFIIFATWLLHQQYSSYFAVF